VACYKAMGCKGSRAIRVVPSPIYTRGCAEVGEKREAKKVVIAIASPSRFSMRRLSRVAEHELLHTMGYEHDAMRERDMYSMGEVPLWARGLKMRWVKG
jgi:hypothetical protein